MVIGIIGAIIGALVAIRISPDGFKEVYKYLVLSLLILMIIQSKMDKQSNVCIWSKTMDLHTCFSCIGILWWLYSNGHGDFFLAVMVYVAKLPIIEANAVKVLMVTSYTIIVIGIFHVMGYVDWKIGEPLLWVRGRRLDNRAHGQ